MYLLHWFLATLPLTSLAFGQDCYWPNGGQASALKACSVASGNDAAACCFADHYCMTNGLCMSMTEGSWYRGGCTDQQFLQSGCPRICHSREIVGGGKSPFQSLDRHSGLSLMGNFQLTWRHCQQYPTVMPAYFNASQPRLPVSAVTTAQSRTLQSGRTGL